MVTVKLFGLLQLGGAPRQLEVAPGTVKAAFAQVRALAQGIDEKQLRQALVFINGMPVHGARRLRHPLKDGDELALLSPISGG